MKTILACLYIICASRDGKMLACSFNWGGNIHKTIQIINAESGEEIREFEVERGHRGASFSEDNRRLSVLSYDGVVRVWDISTGKETKQIDGFGQNPSIVAYLPKGGKLEVRVNDGPLRRYDAETGELFDVKPALDKKVDTLGVSADGKTIAWYSDGVIRIAEFSSGRELRHIKLSGWYPDRMLISPDGKLLVASCQRPYNEKAFTARNEAGLPTREGKFFVWKIDTGESLREWTTSTSAQFAVFTPDQKKLAVLCDDPVTRFWDLATGKQQPTQDAHENVVVAVAYSTDGKTVVSAAADRRVRRWDANTGEPTGKFETTLESDLYSSAPYTFSADGRYFAYAGKVWDVANGKMLPNLNKLGLDGFAIGLSRDGKKLAGSTGTDMRLESAGVIVDTATGKTLGKSKSGFGYGHGIQFSPDGNTVAILFENGGMREGTAVVLINSNGQELKRFQSPFLVGLLVHRILTGQQMDHERGDQELHARKPLHVGRCHRREGESV